MRCAVCGADYAAYHVCRGAAPAEEVAPLEPAPALRLAPWHYLREAAAIARWDEAAIRRAAGDNNALLYGFVFWSVGVFLPALRNVALAWLAGYAIPWWTLLGDLAKALALMAFLMVGYFAICHLIARVLFDGRGSYLGILRAMLLGSLVLWLNVVPVVGPLVARLWWGIAILLWVFEEVDAIERLQALAIVVGVPVALLLVGFFASLL
ncbi:MAG: hypothetical protein ACE5H2_09030 [Terriglobia bacterium]